MRGGPDQDGVVPGLPGHPRDQPLPGLLHQRHEGVPGIPRRAGRELGQVHRYDLSFY